MVAYRLHGHGQVRFATFFTVIAVWSFVNACRGVPARTDDDSLLGPPQNNPNRELIVQLCIGFVLFVWAVIWVAQVHPAQAALGITAALGVGGAVLWFLLRGPLVWTKVGRDLGLDFYPGRANDPGLYHGTVEGRMVTLAPSATGRLFRVRITGALDDDLGAAVDLDQWMFGLRAGPDARLWSLDELGGGEGTYLMIQGTRTDAVGQIRQLVTPE